MSCLGFPLTFASLKVIVPFAVIVSHCSIVVFSLTVLNTHHFRIDLASARYGPELNVLIRTSMNSCIFSIASRDLCPVWRFA